MRQIFLFFTIIFCTIPLFANLVKLEPEDNGLRLTTLYGTTLIKEPVLLELINAPSFKRLEKLRQYGVMWYSRANEPIYTRYEHSLGVFFVTRMFGADLAEQIDALLHDVSHTTFCHVADSLFKTNYRNGGKKSYQDGIHEWYLSQTEIQDILIKHGFADACTESMKKLHRRLDQKLPKLCADRIEYNLTGGFIDNLLTAQEVADIFNDLRFEDGVWYFTDATSAKKFGLVSIALSENRWGSAWSSFIDHAAAQALLRARDINLITFDDIHFSTDEKIWQLLQASDDSEIIGYLSYIENADDLIAIHDGASITNKELHLRGKFSGTDPLVKIERELCYLSQLDGDYAARFVHVKDRIARGWDVILKN